MKDEAVVFQEVVGIFREVFESPRLEVLPTTSAKDVDGWDSLSHLNLIVAIEAHFRIRFKLSDIVGFKNVGDMCKAVARATS